MSDIENIKQNIIKICSEFERDNLISILNFLQKEHVDKKYIKQNNDGIRINLDYLSNELIDKLYNYINFKLEEDIKK